MAGTLKFTGFKWSALLLTTAPCLSGSPKAFDVGPSEKKICQSGILLLRLNGFFFLSALGRYSKGPERSLFPINQTSYKQGTDKIRFHYWSYSAEKENFLQSSSSQIYTHDLKYLGLLKILGQLCFINHRLYKFPFILDYIASLLGFLRQLEYNSCW